MNNLFSDDSTKTKSNNLLKQQQKTTEKLTALLEQSTAALTCGPTCQKLKTIDDLKQKYLNAQTNMLTAPVKLENSKKNYYVFTEGEPYYDDMLETELKNKAEIICKKLADSFNDETVNAKTMNSYYNTEQSNSLNTKELYKIYLVKNKEIQKSIKEQRGDVLTNDRKTYYETEALNNLQSWHSFLWYIYYVIFVIFVLVTIFNGSIGIPKKIVFIFLAIIYPYVINIIVKKIYELSHSAWKRLPKNVYNDL